MCDHLPESFSLASILVEHSVTPWTETHKAPLPSNILWSSLKFMSTDSVMSSNHPNLCHPLLLLPSVFSSIRVFSYESALHACWQSSTPRDLTSSPGPALSDHKAVGGGITP